MKYIIVSFLLASMGFCTPDCGDRIPIESSFPEGVADTVPYNTNQSVTFRHNLGKEINYSITREIGRAEDSQCDECCTMVSYDFDETQLLPDYPTFEMGVSLYSYDSIRFSYVLKVANNYFNLGNNEYAMLNDSVKIGDTYFKDVYKIRSSSSNREGIYADSVYYSFSEGFLKIIMSNKEFYEIQ